MVASGAIAFGTGGWGAVFASAIVSAATSAAGTLVAGLEEKLIRGADASMEDAASEAGIAFVTDFGASIISGGGRGFQRQTQRPAG